MSDATSVGELGGVDGGPISGEKIAKITADLNIVRNNMTVFSEILAELNPSGGGDPADLELLQELHRTCKEMQSRVGMLLCTPTTDELTVDMLQINDDMNDLFDRYDRKTAAYLAKGGGKNTVDAPLIDLGGIGDETGAGGGGATPSLIQNLGAMNLHSQQKPGAAGGDADFDQFVTSRSSATPATKTTTTSNPSTKKSTDLFDAYSPELTEEEIIQGHRETDFEEMEAWLKANPGSEASLTSLQQERSTRITSPNANNASATDPFGPPNYGKPS